MNELYELSADAREEHNRIDDSARRGTVDELKLEQKRLCGRP